MTSPYDGTSTTELLDCIRTLLSKTRSEIAQMSPVERKLLATIKALAEVVSRNSSDIEGFEESERRLARELSEINLQVDYR